MIVFRYVEDILHSVPSIVEAVTVDPQGEWTVPTELEDPPRDTHDSDEDDNDDDSLVEVERQNRPNAIHHVNNLSTPVSREPSLATPRPNGTPRPSGGSSNKRPVPAVI